MLFSSYALWKWKLCCCAPSAMLNIGSTTEASLAKLKMKIAGFLCLFFFFSFLFYFFFPSIYKKLSELITVWLFSSFHSLEAHRVSKKLIIIFNVCYYTYICTYILTAVYYIICNYYPLFKSSGIPAQIPSAWQREILTHTWRVFWLDQRRRLCAVFFSPRICCSVYSGFGFSHMKN